MYKWISTRAWKLLFPFTKKKKKKKDWISIVPYLRQILSIVRSLVNFLLSRASRRHLSLNITQTESTSRKEQKRTEAADVLHVTEATTVVSGRREIWAEHEPTRKSKHGVLHLKASKYRENASSGKVFNTEVFCSLKEKNQLSYLVFRRLRACSMINFLVYRRIESIFNIYFIV